MKKNVSIQQAVLEQLAGHHPCTKMDEQIKIIYTKVLNPPQKSP